MLALMMITANYFINIIYRPVDKVVKSDHYIYVIKIFK